MKAVQWLGIQPNPDDSNSLDRCVTITVLCVCLDKKKVRSRSDERKVTESGGEKIRDTLPGM